MKRFNEYIKESTETDKIKKVVEPIFQELFDIIPYKELTRYYWKNGDSYYTPQVGNNIIAYEMLFLLPNNLEILSDFYTTLNELSKVRDIKFNFKNINIPTTEEGNRNPIFNDSTLEVRVIYIGDMIFPLSELDMFCSMIIRYLKSEVSTVTFIELRQMINYELGGEQIKINVRELPRFDLSKWFSALNKLNKNNEFDIKTETNESILKTIYISKQ